MFKRVSRRKWAPSRSGRGFCGAMCVVHRVDKGYYVRLSLSWLVLPHPQWLPALGVDLGCDNVGMGWRALLLQHLEPGGGSWWWLLVVVERYIPGMNVTGSCKCIHPHTLHLPSSQLANPVVCILHGEVSPLSTLRGHWPLLNRLSQPEGGPGALTTQIAEATACRDFKEVAAWSELYNPRKHRIIVTHTVGHMQHMTVVSTTNIRTNMCVQSIHDSSVYNKHVHVCET